MKRVVQLLFASALISIANAQEPFGTVTVPLPVTQAWHYFITNPGSVIQTGQMDTDRNGYDYIVYSQSNGAGSDAYLRKLGPTSDVPLNIHLKSVLTPETFTPSAVAVTHNTHGPQHVYVVGTENQPTFQPINVWKYDVLGNALWGGPLTLTVSSSSKVLAAYGTADDHLLIAVEANNGGANFLTLYDVAGNQSANDFIVSNIDPQTAQYDPNTDCWFIAGIDATDSTGLPARWGSYFARTGILNFGGFREGSGDPVNGPFIRSRFSVDLLPGGYFALGTNQTTNDGAGNNTTSYQIQITNAVDNTPFWSYPSSGFNTGGQITQVVEDDTSMLYARGIADTGTNGFPLQFLLGLNNNGTLTFNRSQQPVDMMFAMQDGFWDLFNWPNSSSIFLEHFSTANFSYTWGKQYAPSTVQTFTGRLVQYGNSAYVSHDSGNDVSIDRFVTGTTLKSITCPSTFTGGNVLPVTINLNQPVPAGQTVTVALNVNTTGVHMPNGTQGQNFTLTAGQSSTSVVCTTVAGTGQVRFLGINQGVRRTADSQGT